MHKTALLRYLILYIETVTCRFLPSFIVFITIENSSVLKQKNKLPVIFNWQLKELFNYSYSSVDSTVWTASSCVVSGTSGDCSSSSDSSWYSVAAIATM